MLFVIGCKCCFGTCDSFQDESDLLLKDGNCQLLALAHATGRYKEIIDIAAEVTEENQLAASSGYRTYKQTFSKLNVECTAVVGLPVDALSHGKYVMHVHGDGVRKCCLCIDVCDNDRLTVYHGTTVVDMTMDDLRAIVNKSVDRKYTVLFRLEPLNAACGDVTSKLLGLVSGAGKLHKSAHVPVLLPNRPIPSNGRSQPRWVHRRPASSMGQTPPTSVLTDRRDLAPCVDPMSTFNSFLRGEVSEQRQWLESWRFDKQKHSYLHNGVRKYKHHRCPLCPFHSFAMHPCNFRKNYNSHLDYQHAPSNGVTCRNVELSCTRSQTVWRCAREIFDNESMSGHYAGYYLRRACEYFRESVRLPAGQRTHTSMDRKDNHSMVLVLGDHGPAYHMKSTVATSSAYRQLYSDDSVRTDPNAPPTKTHYYTKGFAELFTKAMLMHSGSVHEARRELVRTFNVSGNPLANMMPQSDGDAATHKFWRRLTDELIFGEHMTARLINHLGVLSQLDEFAVVNMDCGLRPFRCIKGQADYRAEKDKRQQALYGDNESITRYCTIAGRTGGIGLCCPILTESGVCCSNAVIDNWRKEWRERVQYCGTDNATGELETSMLVAYPNMIALFQDPLHPCFKLEHGLKHKRIPATNKFRKIMAKFSALNPDTLPASWGPFYTTDMDIQYTQAEKRARQSILDRSMPAAKAAKMIADINPKMPFANRIEFFQLLAAFVIVYPSMALRRTRDRQRKHMYIYIHGLTAPATVEYLFNGLRMLHTIPISWASVLAVGTTSAETICRRVNKLTVSQERKYAMTVCTRLRSFWLQSVESFVNVTQRPTTRQRRAHQYDLFAQSNFHLTNGEWRRIRMASHAHPRTDTTAKTHRMLKQGGYNMYRSDSMEKAVHERPIKRTPFNLRRKPTGH